jgi:hypothetical protein
MDCGGNDAALASRKKIRWNQICLESLNIQSAAKDEPANLPNRFTGRASVAFFLDLAEDSEERVLAVQRTARTVTRRRLEQRPLSIQVKF